jgi:hypothetical protein
VTFPICRTVGLVAILVLAGCRREHAGTASGTEHSAGTMRSLRSAALCTVRGTVKLSDGTPAYAAAVEMVDSYVPPETRETICGTASHSNCKPLYVTEEDGRFSVTAIVMEDFQLAAMGLRLVSPEKTEMENGARIFSSCPTARVVLTLDPAFTIVVFLVGVEGKAISWAPEEHGITKLKVTSRAGLKWEIRSTAGKVMRSPLVYGVVPAGAAQIYPIHGTPAPLAPGDTVAVLADGSSIEGAPHTGSGDYQIPDTAPTVEQAEEAALFRGWFGRIFNEITELYTRPRLR